MIRCNVHSHTVFSDGRNTPEEMVLEALKRGFGAFGLSDHGYSPWDDGSIPCEKEPAYRDEVRRLQREYAGRIELPLGIERDATTPEKDISAYDYAIESVHFLRYAGEVRPIDYSFERLEAAVNELFGGDWYAMIRRYFDEVCESISRPGGQIVGHVGLVTKFNLRHPRFDETDARYLGPARDTLKYIAERDLIAEVNTGAMSRGWRDAPYPGDTLLRAFADMGGRVIVTSDCHRAEWMDWAFDETYEAVRAAGFREAQVWHNGGFEATGL